MKQQDHKTPSHHRPLWQRLLERHRHSRQLMRVRVPLVLFRPWSAKNSAIRPTIMQPHIVRYPLTLQIQLSWPSFVKAHSSHVTLQQFNLIRDHFQRTPDSPALQSSGQTTSVTNSYATVVGEREQLRAAPAFLGDVGTSPLEPKAARSLSPEPKGESSLSVTPGGAKTLWREPKAAFQNRRPVARIRSGSMGAHLSTDIGIRATQRILNNTFVKTTYLATLDRQTLSALPVTTVATPTRRKVHHEIFWRHAISPELRRNIEATSDFVLPVKSQPMIFTKTFGDREASSGREVTRLYALPAWRNFVSEPTPRENKPLNSKEQASPAPQHSSPPPQPAMDISRLSEEVYRHIQRKIRIERERRGL